MVRYRAYHGATYLMANLTGDPRRWANETRPCPASCTCSIPTTVPDAAGWTTPRPALADLEETIELEGPHTIAAFILEPVTGTNGILIPPDGYLQGVRELCTKYGILMIGDEVMCRVRPDRRVVRGRTTGASCPTSSRWPRG